MLQRSSERPSKLGITDGGLLLSTQGRKPQGLAGVVSANSAKAGIPSAGTTSCDSDAGLLLSAKCREASTCKTSHRPRVVVLEWGNSDLEFSLFTDSWNARCRSRTVTQQSVFSASRTPQSNGSPLAVSASSGTPDLGHLPSNPRQKTTTLISTCRPTVGKIKARLRRRSPTVGPT